MIGRILNKYTFILFLMLVLHIITIAVNGVLTRFDFVIIIFILTMDCVDEDNYIFMSMLFGFFSDFIRDGFFGPGVVLFLAYYLIRFRTDVIMDMTKLHYRLFLFSSMSFIYCMYNLYLTDYTFSVAVPIAIFRTVLNVGVVLVINTFFKGYCIAVKNT